MVYHLFVCVCVIFPPWLHKKRLHLRCCPYYSTSYLTYYFNSLSFTLPFFLFFFWRCLSVCMFARLLCVCLWIIFLSIAFEFVFNFEFPFQWIRVLLIVSHCWWTQFYLRLIYHTKWTHLWSSLPLRFNDIECFFIIIIKKHKVNVCD